MVIPGAVRRPLRRRFGAGWAAAIRCTIAASFSAIATCSRIGKSGTRASNAAMRASTDKSAGAASRALTFKQGCDRPAEAGQEKSSIHSVQ